MTSPADFLSLFAECKTERETNNAYHRGIGILQEAHRLALVKVIARRDTTSPLREAQKAVQDPLVAIQRSHDTLIRQWATAQGIPFQRVSKKLRELYEEAHNAV